MGSRLVDILDIQLLWSFIDFLFTFLLNYIKCYLLPADNIFFHALFSRDAVRIQNNLNGFSFNWRSLYQLYPPQTLESSGSNIFSCYNLPLLLTCCSPKHNVANRMVFKFFFCFSMRLNLDEHLRIKISNKNFAQRFNVAVTSFYGDKSKIQII